MEHRGPHAPDAHQAPRSGENAEQKTSLALIEAFDHLLAKAQASCRQERSRDRLRSHLLAQLVCLGEHTISGLLCATGEQFRDWTAAYRFYSRQRVDPAALFAAVRQELEASLPASQPLVVALDDSILRKRGRKMPFTNWRPDPLGPPFQVNFAWSQRVVQLSAALPEGSAGSARTLPIDFAQAPSACRPRRSAPPEQWAAYRREQKVLNINRQAVERLECLTRQRMQEGQERPLWATVDGRFTNKTFLKNAPPQTVIIGRIRGDARLHEAVCLASNKRVGGRPRRYGPLLPTPDALRQDDQFPWQTVEAFAAGRRHAFRVKTLSNVRWRVTGVQRQLRLIVLAPLGYRLSKSSRVCYRKPAYLICTDPELPLEQVLQAYVWRWGIEVNFRDEKTLLGVGQARLRNPHAAELAPAVAVAAYSMLLMASAKAKVLELLPLPSWRQSTPPAHATTAALISRLRYELWRPALRPGFSDFMNERPPAQNDQKPTPRLASSVLYAIAG